MYYTIVLYYLPPHEHPTVWHPTTPTGPFAVLTRGAFLTEADAREWAQANLRPEHSFIIRPLALEAE